MQSNDLPELRIAVVGAGITGLAAALRLQQRAPEAVVQVLEASHRPGGVIQTVQQSGCVLELGPDSILRRLPWGVELCEQLGLQPELQGTQPAARGVYSVHQGRLVRMPDGLAIMAPSKIWPMLTTPLLSWPGKLRMGCERLLPARCGDTDESLAEFARRRFGREGYQRIIQPLAGGVFMGDPEQLSLRSCFPQFHEMEQSSGSLIKATRKRKPASGKLPESVFVAPKLGLQRIIDRLAEHLANQLRLNHKVVRLAQAAGRWQLSLQSSPSTEPVVETYDRVLLATPAVPTARILSEVDPPLAEAMAGIASSSCVIVQLVVDKQQLRQPLDAAGIVVPDVERRPLQACSFSSAKYAGRAAEGKAILRAFFGGALRPELVELSDQQLTDLAHSELAELLGLQGEAEAAVVQRWPQSMPQYQLGHAQRIESILQRAAQLPGLELAGAAYHGVGIPHCIRSGQEAADRLLG